MKFIRQGDLLFRKIDKLPKIKGKIQKDNIVAFSKATGHNHKLVADTLNSKDIKVWFNEQLRYVQISLDSAKLIHQEHKTLRIPKGTYEVTIERERDPFTKSINQVID